MNENKNELSVSTEDTPVKETPAAVEAEPEAKDSPAKEESSDAKSEVPAEKEESIAVKGKKKGDLVACLGWCPATFFVPLVANECSELAKHNANQGAISLLLLIAVYLLNTLGGLFPYNIAKIFAFVMLGLDVLILAVVCVGMVRGYNGKKFEFPLLGKINLFKAIKGE